MANNIHIKATGSGSLIQQLRLWSGLIILVYVTFHFINHALGLVSLDAMEKMLGVMSFVWGTIPGTVVLYGAFLIHILLGIWSIINIRTLRMPLWRWVQIFLGLAIPYWLISHVLITKGSELLTGLQVTYLQEFAFLWPVAALKQNALLIIVWIHAMMGVHFWLKPQRWYQDWGGLLQVFTAIIPILSMSGWMVAAQRELLLVRSEPTGQATADLQKIMDTARDSVAALRPLAQQGVVYVLIGVLVLFALLFISRKLRKRVQVSYGRELTVDVTPGITLLDASREAGIPHMSICGGRARCSTCRVMIISDQNTLSPIGPAERKLLNKIDAEPNIRLACQARVRGNTEIRPIIQPTTTNHKPLNIDPYSWGDEREVTVLCLNIRDFTALAEKSLTYDTVFILNHFFDLMVAEIEASGGYVDKFVGDGLIAIFGLETVSKVSSREALTAAVNCQQTAQKQDDILAQHLDNPLEIGIGVHTGKVIIGRIGKTGDQTHPSRITAIGNVVKVASTMERLSKKAKAHIIYSRSTHEFAGLGMSQMIGETAKVQVKNNNEPIESIIIKNSGALRKALEPEKPYSPAV